MAGYSTAMSHITILGKYQHWILSSMAGYSTGQWYFPTIPPSPLQSRGSSLELKLQPLLVNSLLTSGHIFGLMNCLVRIWKQTSMMFMASKNTYGYWQDVILIVILGLLGESSHEQMSLLAMYMFIVASSMCTIQISSDARYDLNRFLAFMMDHFACSGISVTQVF